MERIDETCGLWEFLLKRKPIEIEVRKRGCHRENKLKDLNEVTTLNNLK